LPNINIDYTNKTMLYRTAGDTEHKLGYVDDAGTVFKLRWDEGVRVGRIADHRVFRDTRHDEREVGSFTDEGVVRSHGLFEGGEMGWVEPDGVVVQAGLILGEEEVGRVEGDAKVAAGAALLLIFMIDEQEERIQSSR